MATITEALNRSNPTEVADLLRYIKAGDLLSRYSAPVVETVPVSNDVATLANPPAMIVAVYATQGTVTGPKTVIPPIEGGSIASGEVEWDHQANRKNLTFAAVDQVTQAVVSYVALPEYDHDVFADQWPTTE